MYRKCMRDPRVYLEISSLAWYFSSLAWHFHPDFILSQDSPDSNFCETTINKKCFASLFYINMGKTEEI